jgi:hypothetical protein
MRLQKQWPLLPRALKAMSGAKFLGNQAFLVSSPVAGPVSVRKWLTGGYRAAGRVATLPDYQ